ncbi:tripartite tricarboxylate transporter substrate binding protein [Pigmentiphaga sp.]|uniref:Bug family tripartite tricarboxylate transporter substrate binding protein n=1 Tax=Pigmentiphaga sp. TaxID=1977564 RepID=UPI0025ED63CA|nr:tripartite tricarboxylate transporter substrate binding protein [Pigmentiphaga sp.]
MSTRHPRTRRALLAAALTTLACAGAPAQAQAPFPDRPLKLVIGFAAGGSTDIVGRMIAQKMSVELGKPVVVINRPGASGAIGTTEVARAEPDGYTVLVNIVTTAVINPLTQKNLPYDPIKDLQPVAMVGKLPNVIILNKNVPAHDLREFIAWAKANPGKVTFGTGGAGGVQHLSGELLAKMAGIQMTHVPYKGAAPAIQDLLAGNITAVFDNVTGPISLIKAGQVTALGVTTEERIAVLPEVPTIAESGLPAFKNSSWISIFTRAGLPPAVLARLESAVLAAARDPETVAKLKELGAVPSPMNTAELDRFWRSEFTYWRDAIKAANLSLE